MWAGDPAGVHEELVHGNFTAKERGPCDQTQCLEKKSIDNGEIPQVAPQPKEVVQIRMPAKLQPMGIAALSKKSMRTHKPKGRDSLTFNACRHANQGIECC